jgi:DNA-binding transcriptional LysR family regulator
MPVPARHTLDQLLVLEAIVQTGSFAGAARALHRVPSAISYSVAGLESALGVTIFDRGGHKAALSAEGRRVLGAAAAMLESARRLDALGLALAGGFEPSLELVVDGALPMRPVLRALRAFGALGLPTRVQLAVEHQDGVVERFSRESADLMLALDLENAGAVQAEPLPPLELRLLTRADHPLLGAGPIDRSALQAHTELVVRASTQRAQEAPRDPWFGGPQALSLSDFHAKRLALLEGLGFGWMPVHLVEDDIQQGVLVVVPVDEGASWTYRPALAWRAGRPLGPAGERLRALLLEAHGTPA